MNVHPTLPRTVEHRPEDRPDGPDALRLAVIVTGAGPALAVACDSGETLALFSPADAEAFGLRMVRSARGLVGTPTGGPRRPRRF